MHSKQEISVFLKRKMRFWDPLGSTQEFSIQTFIKVMKHPKFLLFGGLTLVFFFATDPSTNRPYVPLWASAAIWPIAYVIYMSLYALALCVLSGLTKAIPRLRTPTSLLGFLTLFPTIYFCENVLLNIMSGGTYPSTLNGNYLFYFLAVQVSEAVFFKYIYPGMDVHEADVEENADDRNTEAETSKHIIIGGERIPLRQIHLIEAREHHVHVTLSDSRRRLRARLGDVVAQTSSEDGIQTHRSWWVARHAAKELGEENGRPVMRLRDNAHIPVARTRVSQVRTWAEDHLEDGIQAKPAAE